MSEPMPGGVPAQQYGDPVPPPETAGPAGAAGGVETDEAAAPAGQVEGGDAAAEGESSVAIGPSDVAEAAEVSEPQDPQEPQETEDEEPEDDDGPRPLGLQVEPTGHGPVDARLRRLDDADHLAVSGHMEVYEDVHQGLRDTLAALDRPGPGPGPGASPRPGAPGPTPAPGPAVHGRPAPAPPYPRS